MSWLRSKGDCCCSIGPTQGDPDCAHGVVTQIAGDRSGTDAQGVRIMAAIKKQDETV